MHAWLVATVKSATGVPLAGTYTWSFRTARTASALKPRHALRTSEAYAHLFRMLAAPAKAAVFICRPDRFRSVTALRFLPARLCLAMPARLTL